jgi:HK97 family phage major capsid protein
MMTTRIQELRMKRDALGDELVRLAAADSLNRGQEERFSRATRERDRVTAEIVRLEERQERLSDVRRDTTREISGANFGGERAEEDVATGRRLDERQVAALRTFELRGDAFGMAPDALDRVDRLVRRDKQQAAEFEVHSRPEYESAFMKLATVGDSGRAALIMNDAERAAMSDSFQVRAQSETNTAGGYAVPVFIDPTVILSDQETNNPFLQIARVVDVNTNAWKGVSAAGVSWSFDAEGAEVSDDSITIAQPSVTIFSARGFIPYTIEISEDWPGFAAEMGRLLSIGYDELLIDKFTRGSGNGEPRGILTALQASSGPVQWVTSTTDGAFGQEDIYATWAALPQKFQRRAAWQMNVDVNDRIRQMGTANVYHAVTVDLPAGAADLLMGSPVYMNPYMPVFSSTTGVSPRMIVGDWSNYVVARRTGLVVELVPHLFSTGAGRPSGSRGWFAHARIGGNSVLDASWKLQQNV